MLVNSVWRRWDFLKRAKQKELAEIKQGKGPLKLKPRYDSSVKLDEVLSKVAFSNVQQVRDFLNVPMTVTDDPSKKKNSSTTQGGPTHDRVDSETSES